MERESQSIKLDEDLYSPARFRESLADYARLLNISGFTISRLSHDREVVDSLTIGRRTDHTVKFMVRAGELGIIFMLGISESDHERCDYTQLNSLANLIARMTIDNAVTLSQDLYRIEHPTVTDVCRVANTIMGAEFTVFWTCKSRNDLIRSFAKCGLENEADFVIAANEGIIGSSLSGNGFDSISDLSRAVHQSVLTKYGIREIILYRMFDSEYGHIVLASYVNRSHRLLDFERYLFESVFGPMVLNCRKVENQLETDRKESAKREELAEIVNHGLGSVLQLHDVKNALDDVNSSIELIRTYAGRGSSTIADKNMMASWFSELELAIEISKSWSKSSRLGNPDMYAQPLIEFLMRVQSSWSGSLKQRKRPIQLHLRIETPFFANPVTIDKGVFEQLHSSPDRRIKSEIRRLSKLKVRFDENQMYRLFSNLIDNAAYWSELNSARKKPNIYLVLKEMEDSVELGVRDQGTGLVPIESGSPFDLGQTSKPEGLGFGLFVSQKIAKLHGTEIHYADARPGAYFHLALHKPVDK